MLVSGSALVVGCGFQLVQVVFSRWCDDLRLGQLRLVVLSKHHRTRCLLVRTTAIWGQPSRCSYLLLLALFLLFGSCDFVQERLGGVRRDRLLLILPRAGNNRRSSRLFGGMVGILPLKRMILGLLLSRGLIYTADFRGIVGSYGAILRGSTRNRFFLLPILALLPSINCQ